MKRWMVALLVWLVGVVVAAQDSNAPLIAVFNEQIYRLEDEALIAYDACMPDERLTPQFFSSPDGTKFVFATLPRIIAEMVEEFGSMGGDGPVGFNFWLCDTTSDTLTRIHAVEGGDEPFTGEFPALVSISGRPVWSPDSSQIAYSTLTLADEIYGLTVYDVSSGESSASILDLPAPFNFPVPPELYWDADGLYMSLYTFNEETFVGEDKLYTYDLAAEEFVSEVVLLSEGESSDFITDRLPVNRDGKDLLAVHLFEGGWRLVNPATGEQQVLDGVPLAYASGGADGINLVADVTEDNNFSWQLVGTDFVLEAYPRQRVAIAPDGQTLAYADSTLHLWRDGEVVDIANSDGFADDIGANILWGQLAWDVAAGEGVAEAPLPTCESAPPSRLRAGDNARVISGTVPNRLRSNPTTAAEQLGQIPGGAGFMVLDGPVCADDYAWYRVQYLDIQGWTAEGSGESYFVEPVGDE